MTGDRRNAHRVQVAIRPWRVDLIDTPVDSSSCRAAEIVDLSHDGARLRAAGDIVVEDRLALDFQYRNRRFTVPGRVVWVQADGNDPAIRDLGVHFDEVEPLTRARLESVLGRTSGARPSKRPDTAAS